MKQNYVDILAPVAGPAVCAGAGFEPSKNARESTARNLIQIGSINTVDLK